MYRPICVVYKTNQPFQPQKVSFERKFLGCSQVTLASTAKPEGIVPLPFASSQSLLRRTPPASARCPRYRANLDVLNASKKGTPKEINK